VIWGNLLPSGVFLTKAFAMVLIMMWVAGRCPAARGPADADVLEYLVPLTFVNLLGVSLWLLLFKGKGIPG